MNLQQNLYITYSNQKAREIKGNIANPLDKVITLEDLAKEITNKYNFKTYINDIVVVHYLYKIIQEKNIEYFNFISNGSDTLELLYDFLLKVDASTLSFSDEVLCFSSEKQDALQLLFDEYNVFKEKNNLIDKNDMYRFAIENLYKYAFNSFENIYTDSFVLESIKLYKSNLEYELLNLVSSKSIELDIKKDTNFATLYQLENQPFDIVDEVQCSLKLARKLLEEDSKLSTNDICIITTDINEYAPIFRLYLNMYNLKGYDSKGISLNLYNNKNSSHIAIQNAFLLVENQLNSIIKLCNQFDIPIDKNNIKEKLIKETTVLEEKVGIELTEANQFMGLNKKYKHVIFIGTDINHLPPKRSDNFLYSSEVAQKYFCENSYYDNSSIQYNELKSMAENLYILYPKYNGKRELSPSIIIDKNIRNTIDISNIKAAKNKIEQLDYLDSINSTGFTKYDGLDVDGINAKHLSASQLGSYAKCPLKYLYNYKLGIKKPKEDEDGFDVMQMGTLMHSCYEEFAKEVQGKNNLEIVDFKTIMLNILEVEYKKFLDDPRNEIESENIYHKIYKYTLAKGLSNDRDNGLLINFINYYDENKEELNYFIESEFEKEFALDDELKPYVIKDKNDKNYFIKGYIDRFDHLENHINIVDYKSKKADGVLQDKLKEIQEFKDFQLGLYTLYAEQEYKKDIDAYLQTFKSTKKHTTLFARVATNEDFIPVVRKKPTGILYDTNYDHAIKTKVYEIKEKIEQGDFRFDNSSEEYCGYCEIKYMCNESLLDKVL